MKSRVLQLLLLLLVLVLLLLLLLLAQRGAKLRALTRLPVGYSDEWTLHADVRAALPIASH